MTKAVIFDLNGVIFNRFSDMVNLEGILSNMDGREIHLRSKIPEFQNFLEGKISEDEYWNKVIEENSWDN